MCDFLLMEYAAKSDLWIKKMFDICQIFSEICFGMSCFDFEEIEALRPKNSRGIIKLFTQNIIGASGWFIHYFSILKLPGLASNSVEYKTFHFLRQGIFWTISSYVTLQIFE